MKRRALWAILGLVPGGGRGGPGAEALPVAVDAELDPDYLILAVESLR